MAAVAAVGLWNWHAERLQVASLEKQVAALQKDEMRSAIVSSVSKQLGDIAADQQRIAEERLRKLSGRSRWPTRSGCGRR